MTVWMKSACRPVTAHVELKDGKISHYSVRPEDFDIASRDDYSMLQIDDAESSLRHA